MNSRTRKLLLSLAVLAFWLGLWFLAAKLVDSGVSKDKIYAYTFATPAAVLTVEERPLPSPGETAAPVQELRPEAKTSSTPGKALAGWALAPLALFGVVFVVFLLVRRKKR